MNAAKAWRFRGGVPAWQEPMPRISLETRRSVEGMAEAFIFHRGSLAYEIEGESFRPDFDAGMGNRL